MDTISLNCKLFRCNNKLFSTPPFQRQLFNVPLHGIVQRNGTTSKRSTRSATVSNQTHHLPSTVSNMQLFPAKLNDFATRIIPGILTPIEHAFSTPRTPTPRLSSCFAWRSVSLFSHIVFLSYCFFWVCCFAFFLIPFRKLTTNI